VDATNAMHETPNPTNKLKAMTRNMGTVYRAYLLVGRGTQNPVTLATWSYMRANSCPPGI
jgi:hypothetical protein